MGDSAATRTSRTNTSDPTSDRLLLRWSEMAEASSAVDPQLYGVHDVKRGLRDVSGKGVLAGLTQIGDVLASAPDDPPDGPVHGQLIYRGIEIRDLVSGFARDGRYGFEETAYLLLFGTLPDAGELAEFENVLAAHRALPKRFVHDAILRMPTNDMMNAMARGVLALYASDEHPDDTSIPNVLRQSLRLIATFPVLAVNSYRAYLHHFRNESLVIHSPQPELSTAENILFLLRRDNRYSQLESRLLDLSLVLHAEHGGGNNSSFTTHVVSSSGTDTYSAIAASLGSLKGPKHGGANIKVVQMFDDLKEEVDDWDDDEAIEEYLTRLLTKEAFDRSGLIYGMGHPVYSTSDPRTEILKSYAADLAEEKGLAEEFRLYERVERLAPQAIGKKRTVYKGVGANVDFYSGLVYKMMDIPWELYTPLFAIARVVGWSAHRIEELASGGKIIRPAYKSVAGRREYTPLEGR
jgi:citrate synthase